MQAVILAHETDFAGWRAEARRLALADVPPEQTVWSVREATDLFAELPAAAPPSAGTFTVPRALVELAEEVVQARDPERFALLYALVWRAHRGERHLLDDAADPQVQRALRLAQSVRRDTHKMRAFVRFREVRDPALPDAAPDAAPGAPPRPAADAASRPAADAASCYVAWFEPEHYILEANAPFFVRRFATMTWSILTPYRSAHWDGERLAFTEGADPAQVPNDDALAAYWQAYFSAIFNPARLKVGAMTSEMPRKYWRNLPEAAAIPGLIRTAQARTERMVEAPLLTTPPSPTTPKERRMPRSATSATPRVSAPVPDAEAPHGSLAELAEQATQCRRCPLWQPATQVVFGEGPADARMMLVGEQPGDQEDLAGRPFVGPAGQLLDRAIAEAGIDRAQVYVTNAVKHFKFEPRGRRRIHAKPGAGEITACRVWVEAERAAVRPALTVLLGATAARSVLGRMVTISRERGRPIALDGGNAQAFVTVHPSYLLRLPDEDAKVREYAAFVADLRQAAALVG